MRPRRWYSGYVNCVLQWMPEPLAPRLDWQGEDRLLLSWPARIDPELNRQVHRYSAALRTLRMPGLLDLVPAYASLALYFSAAGIPDRLAVEASIRHAASMLRADEEAERARPLDVPVCYDASLAPDLESAAAQLGLDPETLIRKHLAPVYRVAMIGFAPGFPYLLGLDPALALPRHAQPRASVAAGSVGIAGAQTGIYPQHSPGGWQLIGRTPWRLFDPSLERPARLLPGQRLRFLRIDRERFERDSEHAA